MPEKQRWGSLIRYGKGYISSVSPVAGGDNFIRILFNGTRPLHAVPEFLYSGSQNLLVVGEGLLRSFGGVTQVNPGQGGQVLYTASDSYVGLANKRTVTDGVTVASGATITSATANFTPADVGASISIPQQFIVTTIATVVNSTTITVNSPLPNTTATGQTLTISISGGATASGIGGSVFSYIGRSLWFIGKGAVYFGGSQTTACVATTTLSFRTYTSGTYNNSTTFQAGVAQPSAPACAARSTLGAGFSGKNNGTYSIKVTRYRASTGAESNASSATQVFSAKNQSVRVQMPALDSNGQDRWNIYATAAGYGAVGPFFFLQQVADSALSTIDGIARCIEVEWNDGDLSPILAPTSFNAPPAGTHGFVLENCMAVVGCYGDTVAGVSSSSPGNAIAVSTPNYPESFPSTNLLFLPEPPVHIISKAADGYIYIACRNSIHAVTWSGGSPPLAIQTIWPDIGVQSPNAWCTVNGDIYAYTAKRGAIRTGKGGEPDTSFAARVAIDMEGWDPTQVIVCWSADDQLVCYCYQRTILAYNIAKDTWSAPLKLDPANLASIASGGSLANNIMSAVTFKGTLYLCTDVDYNLYQFNSGPSAVGSVWVARSPWTDAGYPEATKTITAIKTALSYGSQAAADYFKVKIFTDLNNTLQAQSTGLGDTWGFGSGFGGTTIPLHAATRKVNIRPVRSYAIELSGQGQAYTPLEVLVDGTLSNIRI